MQQLSPLPHELPERGHEKLHPSSISETCTCSMLQPSQARGEEMGWWLFFISFIMLGGHPWSSVSTLFVLGWNGRLHPKWSQAQLPVTKLVYSLACKRDIKNTAEEQRKRGLKLVRANVIRFLLSASHTLLDLVVLAKIC